MVFPLNLVSYRWNLMGQWNVHTSRGDRMHVCSVPCCPMHRPHSQCPMRTRCTWEFKTQSEYKVSVNLPKEGGAWTDLRGYTFIPNQNLLQMHKEGSGVLSNTSDPGILLHPLLLAHVWYNHLCGKWCHRKKGKKVTNLSFPSSLPCSSVSWRRRELVECAVSRRETQAIEFTLCGISTVLAEQNIYPCTR